LQNRIGVILDRRTLTIRTSRFPLPWSVSRRIVGCLLTLLVAILLFAGASVDVPVLAKPLQTLALVVQGPDLVFRSMTTFWAGIRDENLLLQSWRVQKGKELNDFLRNLKDDTTNRVNTWEEGVRILSFYNAL